MTESILTKARNEGYREGASQMSQVAYDNGYADGVIDEQRSGNASETRWFLYGIIFGIILSVIYWSVML